MSDDEAWTDGETEITKESFLMVAKAITIELLMIFHAAREQNAKVDLDVMEMPNFFGTLWEVTRPGCRMFRFDLSGKVDHLPEADVYGRELRYWVFMDADGDVGVSFVEGSATTAIHGFSTSDTFSDALQPVLLDLLIDKVGIEPAKARHIFDTGQISKNVKTMLDDALQQRIEAEVASFRAEINSKLDTMFGGGDST